MDYLYDLSFKLRTCKNELIELLTYIETYKTARIEVDWAIHAIDNLANNRSFLKRLKPRGEVYISLPGNLPLYSYILYVIGAACIGNKVKVRPSTKSKGVLLSILRETKLAEALQTKVVDANWNLFLSHAKENANVFIFTGSWENSQLLENRLSKNIKYVYNGAGVCPFVIGPNANIHEAVKKVIETKFFNSGQDCMATECLYIHENLYKQVINLLIKIVRNLKVGPNSLPDTDIGTLMYMDNILLMDSLIEGKNGVIRILERGGLIGDYYHPCILECSPGSTIVTAEKFGPILPVVRYSDDKQLLSYLKIRNHELGITFFGDTNIIPKLNYGHIVINKTLYDFEDSLKPFGGYKQSGFVKYLGKKKEGPISIPYETSEGFL